MTRTLVKFIGLTESSDRIGVSTETLKNWAAIRRFGLRSVRVAGRLVLYRVDVERIARERGAHTDDLVPA